MPKTEFILPFMSRKMGLSYCSDFLSIVVMVYKIYVSPFIAGRGELI